MGRIRPLLFSALVLILETMKEAAAEKAHAANGELWRQER